MVGNQEPEVIILNPRSPCWIQVFNAGLQFYVLVQPFQDLPFQLIFLLYFRSKISQIYSKIMKICAKKVFFEYFILEFINIFIEQHLYKTERMLERNQKGLKNELLDKHSRHDRSYRFLSWGTKIF